MSRPDARGEAVGEFFVFVLIVFSAVWGSAFLAARLKRSSRELEAGSDGPIRDRLRDDLEQLETRVGSLEEELEFFRELRSPQSSAKLPSPESDP